MNRSDFAHFVSLPVQWADMDAVGHVNHAVFFRYVESGRVAYFSALDEAIDVRAGMSDGPILADIQCSFLGQLRYPADIEVGTRTAKLGGKSFTVEAGIFLAGQDEPVATSRAVVVWFDYANQRTTAVPDHIRQRILEIEAVAPEA
ncbi:MAG TPA: thioesterase family protein [Aeromicrobium sp.]|nr:thioesterase family protein [Aeromicrobium sp.]